MSKLPKDLSYFRGKIVPSNEANVNIQTNALQYGTAVFGGIRGYYNKDFENVFIFRIKDHYKRLTNSAKMLQLSFDKSIEDLTEITLNLVKECGYLENIYIRPFVYVSSYELSPKLHDLETDFAIYVLKLNDYIDTKRGLLTKISSWRRIDDNIIPAISKASGGYLNSALAKSEALQSGCDEAIFLDSRGFVAEGSAENLFIVRDGNLITTPVSASILEGITRRSIIELAKGLGFNVIERDILRSELYVSDEVFFSGTGAQVAWVKEIDHRTIGKGQIGPVTKTLQDIFFNIVKNKEEKFKHWLTPVY
ncbi:MAG: branched-chain amino acid transaminase [Leptospiraceae bacterium]|nr:branched-chain amino acid transaminase [Leptospiraceae bacterium]MCP5492932.1 branched-chain amino acid transaminase [Leptospiraceae bacterium]